MMKEIEHQTVILAAGSFPSAPFCLEVLQKTGKIICCDEAADRLVAFGMEPDVIIGDMDSLSERTKKRFFDRIITIEEQETNDLTKAVNYCVEQGVKEVTILGATGLREDHTLGNISLLLEYHRIINARMITDYGEFRVVNSGVPISSFHGEKISFFSIDNQVRVTSKGLRYALDNMQLHNWWRATLNEVVQDSFTLFFESDQPLLLFRVRGMPDTHP